MRLTPKSQGKRVRRPDWAPGRYLDIRHIGPGQIKLVDGTNDRGLREMLYTTNEDGDWIELPKDG